MSKSEKNQELVSNDILIAEYEYISKTISETHEDRDMIINFYNQLFTIGTVAVGFLVANNTTVDGVLANSGYKTEISLFLALLFSSLTYIVLLKVSQLARLRAAWHESVEALNQIKDFYIARDPGITPGFKWRAKTIPPTNKRFSIANLVAQEILLLGSITTAASVFFILYAFNIANIYVVLALVIVSFIAGYIYFWKSYIRLLIDNQ